MILPEQFYGIELPRDMNVIFSGGCYESDEKVKLGRKVLASLKVAATAVAGKEGKDLVKKAGSGCFADFLSEIDPEEKDYTYTGINGYSSTAEGLMDLAESYGEGMITGDALCVLRDIYAEFPEADIETPDAEGYVLDWMTDYGINEEVTEEVVHADPELEEQFEEAVSLINDYCAFRRDRTMDTEGTALEGLIALIYEMYAENLSEKFIKDNLDMFLPTLFLANEVTTYETSYIGSRELKLYQSYKDKVPFEKQQEVERLRKAFSEPFSNDRQAVTESKELYLTVFCIPSNEATWDCLRPFYKETLLELHEMLVSLRQEYGSAESAPAPVGRCAGKKLFSVEQPTANLAA